MNLTPLNPPTDSWYRAILERALDAVVGVDQNQVITDWNRQAEIIFGWKKDDIIGQNFLENLIPNDRRAAYQSSFSEFIKTGESELLNQHLETEALHSDGHIFPIELTVLPLQKDGAYYFYSFIRDITERKNAEKAVQRSIDLAEALLVSETRFRTLFEQAPFSIQLLSADGLTIQVNNAWRKLLHVPEEIIQNYILKTYNILEDPQLEKKGLKDPISKAFSGESVQTPPLIYDPAEMGQPGRARWMEAFLYPVKNPKGEVTEVVLIHEDVTDVKAREEERNRLLEELKDAVRARDDFLSIASHELKTPLTSLKLYAQMQRRRFQNNASAATDPSAVSKLIELTEKQVNRLTQLVEDMFDISRIAHGGIRMQFVLVDLSQLIQDLVERMADQLRLADCRVEMMLLPKIEGRWDASKIEQVFCNLLVNAMKYGKGKPIKISMLADKTKVYVTIEDHGMGIALENQERIFQRFERAISANEISGLGLGLYISREIIHAHHGQITVESEVGKGSKFTVELPLN